MSISSKLPSIKDPVVREALREIDLRETRDSKGNQTKTYGKFYDYGGTAYHVDHPDFGAKGDGTTDDTTAIQAALTLAGTTGGVVTCTPGSTYIVSHTGSGTAGTAGNNPTWRWSLKIPSNVTVDLNGATIKLAASQDTCIFVNENIGTTQDSGIIIRNGTLDGNRANQGASTEQHPLIGLYDVVQPVVENIDAVNANMYFGRFHLIYEGRFVGLHGSNSRGNGWNWGVADQECFRCFIDDIYAEDCDFISAANPGNGAFFHVVNSAIGKVVTSNCNFGVKVAGDHTRYDCNSTIDEVIVLNGADGDDKAFKLQGLGASNRLTGVAVGRVISVDADDNSLYVIYADDCHVEAVVAYGSNGNDSSRDIYIGDSDRFSAGSLKSVEAGTIGCLIDDEADGYFINNITVHNCTGNAVQIESAHEGYIKSLIATDDQGTPTMTRALNVTGLGGGVINEVRTNLDHNTTTPLINIADASTKFFIHRFLMGDPPATLGGTVQLTNGGTTTSVSNTNIFYRDMGTNETTPIIVIIPWNSTTAALGNMRVTHTVYSSGTGFTIQHSTAGASDYVYWRLLGWQNIAQRPA